MAAYTAALSSFTFDAVVMDAVGNMSISIARPPLDVTQVGSANATFLTGVATTAISLDIFYNKANHVKFTDSLRNAASATFTFLTEALDVVTGTGYVVGASIVATNGDVVRGSITIQVTGIVSINAAVFVSGANES
jgi:hypothetical protein